MDNAFPIPGFKDDVNFNGLTKREYFAAAALQGLIANSYDNNEFQPLSTASMEEIAAMARDQADHLIKSLAVKTTGDNENE